MVTSKSQYVLYGTSACHLCEEAKAVLWSLSQGLTFVEEDIAEDDLLFERYGVRIPVLGFKTSASDSLPIQELGWPFDVEGVMAFVEGCSMGVNRS